MYIPWAWALISWRRRVKAPALCAGPLCCPLGTPPGWACRRGSCPSGWRSFQRASAECSRPPAAAADPGKRQEICIRIWTLKKHFCGAGKVRWKNIFLSRAPLTGHWSGVGATCKELWGTAWQKPAGRSRERAAWQGCIPPFDRWHPLCCTSRRA